MCGFGSYGDRLRRERHRSFVGRTTQLEIFHDTAVAPPRPRYNVFFLSGIGGIGKSALLNELSTRVLEARGAQGLASVETSPLPMNIMREWRQQLKHRGEFRAFDAALRRYTNVSTKLYRAAMAVGRGVYNALNRSNVVGAFVAGAMGSEEGLRGFLSQYLDGREASDFIDGTKNLTNALVTSLNKVAASRRVFLFLDDYESAKGEVDQWLRTMLLESELSDNIVLVIAGRERPERMDSGWTAYSSFTYHVDLQPLRDNEVDDYLARMSVTDPAVRASVRTIANGIPWMLKLITDGYHMNPNFVGGSQLAVSDARQLVVNRFLSQLSVPLQGLVERLCTTASFDRGLAHDLGRPPVADLFRELSEFSFVSLRSDGRYAINDVVRSAVAEQFSKRDRLGWLEANQATANHYATELAGLPPLSSQWNVAFLERQRCLAITDPVLAVAEFDQTVGELPVEVWIGPCGAALEILGNARSGPADPRLTFHVGQAAVVANDLATARSRFQDVIHDPAAAAGNRLRSYLELVEVEHRAGQIDNALTFAQEGHRQAVAVGEHGYQAALAARAAEMFGVLGDEARSNDHLTMANAHLDDVESDLLAGQISLLLAHTLIFAGRYPEGLEQTETAGRRWRAIGYEFGVAQADSCRAWLGWLTERISEGLRHGTRALTYFQSVNSSFHAGLTALNIAELHRRRAETEAALAWNRYAEDAFLRSGGVLYAAIAKYRLGRTYLDSHRPREAVHLLQEAANVEHDWVHEKYTLGLTLLFLGEGYVRLSDSRAEQTVLEAERVLMGAQNRHGRALAPLAAARLLRDLGYTDGLMDRVNDALQTAERYGFTDLVAAALLEQARQSAPDDAHRGTLLGRSLSAAMRYSPYLADRTLEQAHALLQAAAPAVRRTFFEVIDRDIDEPDGYGNTLAEVDRVCRVSENFPSLGRPSSISPQLARLR